MSRYAKVCPRCLKNLVPDGIHTCSPTDYARNLEAEVARLREALEMIANASDDDPFPDSIARAALAEWESSR